LPEDHVSTDTGILRPQFSSFKTALAWMLIDAILIAGGYCGRVDDE